MKRIGIVGTGFIAGKHAQGIQQFDNLQLSGVTDVIPEKREAFARDYGAKVYESYADMLSDNNIDIVVLCVPSHLHPELALEAVRAGKPFLLEKPIAMCVTDAQKIVDSAQEAGVLMMVGQSLRFSAAYVQASEWIRSGEIGAIKQVYCARLGQRPSWGSWYRDARKSGGVLYNIMLHDIDYLYSLFGEVQQLYAAGTVADNRSYEDIMATLRFANGVIAVIDGSCLMNPGYPFTSVLRVDGTQGTVEYRFVGGENTELCRHSELYLYKANQPPKLVELKSYSNHGLELSYFADCVEHGQSPILCPPLECVEVVRILQCIEDSLAKDSVIQIQSVPPLFHSC